MKKQEEEYFELRRVGYNIEVSIKSDNVDLSADEFIYLVRKFMAACGYAESTIEEYLGEY